jgi:hypothetical protein
MSFAWSQVGWNVNLDVLSVFWLLDFESEKTFGFGWDCSISIAYRAVPT